jgi:putative ABC transport system substrate-binding protein
MRRRTFISLVGGAAAWPLAASAQQASMPVVGYLSNASRDDDPFHVAFLQGLNEAGYVEARNVIVEYRWAEYQYDRLPALAAELVRRQVAVIFATTLSAVMPAKAATATIPIVFAIGSDPVKFGLVDALNRPGGNMTGVSWLGGPILVAKRLQLLHELVPAAIVIGFLVNPNNPATDAETRDIKDAARSLGLQVGILDASTERELDSAFAGFVKNPSSALVVSTDIFFTHRRDRLVALSARHALPASYAWREYVVAGGLMSYGTNLTDASRQSGVYVGRILKGEKAADLPVQQSTKFQLVINLKTAKALGLTVPHGIDAIGGGKPVGDGEALAVGLQRPVELALRHQHVTDLEV